jgi:hypothetical protein
MSRWRIELGAHLEKSDEPAAIRARRDIPQARSVEAKSAPAGEKPNVPERLFWTT